MVCFPGRGSPAINTSGGIISIGILSGGDGRMGKIRHSLYEMQKIQMQSGSFHQQI